MNLSCNFLFLAHDINNVATGYCRLLLDGLKVWTCYK